MLGSVANAQSIFSNVITDLDPGLNAPGPAPFYYTNNQTSNANIAVTGIGRGSGVNGNAGNDRYNANGWDSPAFDVNDYFTFTLTANPGYVINFNSFVYTGQASLTGPHTSFAFRSNLDGFTANIGSPIEAGTTISLAGAPYQSVTSITFNFYAWGASNSLGTFSINDFTFNGTVTTSNTITTTTVTPTSSPFTLATCGSTATGTVSFTSSGSFFGGNTYTAQLSDPTGSFAAPVNIGSLASTANAGTISITIPANTNGGAGYKIRVISSNPNVTGSPSGAFNIVANYCATSPTDYFRSNVASGNWNIPGTWQSSQTGGAPWITATAAPTQNATSVLIQAAQTVIINTSVTVNHTQVSGILQLLNNAGSNLGVLTMFDGGATDELTINNGGVLQVVSTGGPNYNSGGINYGASGNINVLTGGIISIGDGAGGHTSGGYYAFGTDPSTKVYWHNGSILEWNSTAVNTPSITGDIIYFPNALTSEIPILRLTKTSGTLTGTATTCTINGIMEVNFPNNITGTGIKFFRDGLSGTSTLTTAAGVPTQIMASTAIIGGSLSLVLGGTLSLNNGVTIPPGANVNISGTANITKTAGDLLVNGTLDMTTVTVSNTSGTVTVNGTLKTGNANGVYAATGTVTSGTILFNTNSTIEYNAAGAQAVQGATVPLYYNLTISNSGTKTLASANVMTGAGTITVSGSAILNSAIHNLGSAATSLTMTGTSKFMMGGSGSKPDAGGTYTLGATTTIEYDGASAITVRLGSPAINYAKMLIVGSNVSNSSTVTGIKFQAGGTFTVNAGGRFALSSLAGFSGASNTAISNVNNPSIVLNNNSTIDYNGTSDQAITNAQDYKILFVSGTGNKTAPAGVLGVQGNFQKYGASTFVHNNGTVLFDGAAAQRYYLGGGGLPPVTFYNVTNSNTVGFTVDSSMSIAGMLSLGASSKIILNGRIKLLSNAAGTASVDQVPATATITYQADNNLVPARFIVERYVPNHTKAWQFLAVPVQAEQTVNAAWQEGNVAGGNNTPGYGTIITGTGSGFDITTLLPSMKTYNSATADWSGIPNTSQLISNAKGYMVFVRGDRSVQTSAAAATTTILRTTGKIYIGDAGVGGDKPPVIPVAGGVFESAANPYASQVDLTKLMLNNTGDVQDYYVVWDPLLGGAYNYGGYRTLTRNGATYDVTPPGGNYPAQTKYIQSGQAFFVHSFSTGGTVSFQENNKVSGSSIFTKGGLGIDPPHNDQRLNANLYLMNSGSAMLVDGVLSQFSASYSNRVDAMDALKMDNARENMSIVSGENKMSVERRGLIEKNDTIFYNIAQLRVQSYTLQFTPQNLYVNGLTAYLMDRFMNTATPVSLHDTTAVTFAVTADPLSAAVNRFYLVFRRTAQVPPVQEESSESIITVAPNPVTDHMLNLLFRNQAPGKYRLQLLNSMGQAVYSNTIQLTNNIEKISFFTDLPAGDYLLNITGPANKMTAQKVIIR